MGLDHQALVPKYAAIDTLVCYEPFVGAWSHASLISSIRLQTLFMCASIRLTGGAQAIVAYQFVMTKLMRVAVTSIIQLLDLLHTPICFAPPVTTAS